MFRARNRDCSSHSFDCGSDVADIRLGVRMFLHLFINYHSITLLNLIPFDFTFFSNSPVSQSK